MRSPRIKLNIRGLKLGIKSKHLKYDIKYWMIDLDPDDRPVFPTKVMIEVKALAYELPFYRGIPQILISSPLRYYSLMPSLSNKASEIRMIPLSRLSA